MICQGWMPRRRDNTSRGRGPYLFSDFDCPQALRNGDHANKSHIEQSQSQNYGGVKRQKICLAVPGGLGTGWRTAISDYESREKKHLAKKRTGPQDWKRIWFGVARSPLD